MVHAIVAPTEFVTDQVTTPVGCGPPPGPVAITVTVVLRPNVGVPAYVTTKVTGVLEIPRVTPLDGPER